MKKSLNTMLSRAHNFVNEVTSPWVKSGKLDEVNDVDPNDTEDILVGEHAIQSEMLDGSLSLAAVVSIEQFSRYNTISLVFFVSRWNSLYPSSITLPMKMCITCWCSNNVEVII